MARKKPSIQSLVRNDRGFADIARTYAELPLDGRSTLIQFSHYLKRAVAEIETKLEEKYKKKLAALQKAAEGHDDPD